MTFLHHKTWRYINTIYIRRAMEVLRTIMASRTGRILVTCSVALAWMTVSSGLIFLNKWIMSADKFEYPMFLAGLGMLFSGFASFTCCRV